jgi:hypothetical protein
MHSGILYNPEAGFISNCRFIVVGGVPTAHGSQPWWVSSPTSDNLK